MRTVLSALLSPSENQALLPFRFEIYVNGTLIYSKLRSNKWPNLEKIVKLVEAYAKEI